MHSCPSNATPADQHPPPPSRPDNAVAAPTTQRHTNYASGVPGAAFLLATGDNSYKSAVSIADATFEVLEREMLSKLQLRMSCMPSTRDPR
jgi:hypothetical protein